VITRGNDTIWYGGSVDVDTEMLSLYTFLQLLMRSKITMQVYAL